MPIPTDPLLSSQWHLLNTIPGLLDLNVTGVWDPTQGAAYTGVGTRTIVIDNGVDYTHPDLAPNYDQGLDFDFESNTLDAFGFAAQPHGTAVAGIIGADNNGTGAVGVAFDTSLVGYRTANLISDAWLQDVRDAIHHAAVSAQGDVANISLGIANDADSEFGAGYNATRFDEIEASIGDAVNLGRGGLGMTIVKSAGNSRADAYDVNVDDWTNDTRQVVVAAVDQNGFVSSYSSFGAANLVSGFGTPGQVVTTDRVGAAGYNNTDFTFGFNGTSSAAPMVTGVVALMYDANAGLGWRDVQSILASSARHVGSNIGGGIGGSERFAWGWNGADTWNGGGLHYSNDYGYGLVDALAAVRLAETWLLTGSVAGTTANQFSNTMDVLNSTVVVPDANLTGLTFSGNAAFNDIVDRVTVQMSFSTTYIGDLEFYVTSPNGTVSQLINDVGGGNPGDNFSGTWTFESQAFRGERAAGTWSVRVVDDAGGDVLSVSDVVIRTFGSFTSHDRYIFTNEYSNYAGISGHTTVISDTNGGTDTANAAAVSSASNIRLDGTVGSIDGVAVTFTNIEHAIGGDGNDTLVGNAGANKLYGMRGNDTINGGAGSDTVDGGAGNDRVFWGPPIPSLADVRSFDGGTGIDTIDGGGVNFGSGAGFNLGAGTYTNGGSFNETWVNFENYDNAASTSGSEFVTGTAGANVIRTGGGNNVINGGGGADIIDAGAGNDIITDANSSIIGDSFNGGAGIDTLIADFTWVDAVAYDLALGWMRWPGVGGTTYDTILNIENLTIGGGADVTGTTGANVITVLDTGFDHNNTINVGAGDDTVNTGIGNDTIDGGAGNDTSIGGAGDDTYLFDTDLALGTDTLNESGGGIDTLNFSATTTRAVAVNLANAAPQVVNAGLTLTLGSGATFENVIGGSLADKLTGNALANTLTGLAGNDTINAGGGNDTSIGGAGNDTYLFDTDLALGSDTLNESGGGIDTLDFSSTTTRAVTVNLANAAAQVVNAGLTLTLGSGATFENVIGGSLADKLTGNALSNTLTGLAGNDTINAGGGNDTSIGGAGNDTYLFDTDLALGSDTLNESGGGIDTLDFSSTTTRAVTVNLENAAAQVVNLGLTLTLGSGATFENVIGGSLADNLRGNDLANILTGGRGSDTLFGDLGKDFFNFQSALNSATNVDHVKDFVAADDTFWLDDAVFAGIGPVGTIAAANFVHGASAGDASDRVIYDAPTGQLFFDADGTGAGAQVLFTTVVASTTVNFGDIWIS